MSWGIVAPLAVLTAAAAPFVVERRRPSMEDAARDAAPGRFAELSDGLTHFRWHGPEEGPVIVCIHGLTTPSLVWDGLAHSLAARGFRVLTYDLFGRGYSDRPKGAQTRAFFLRQLRELLSQQELDGDLTLIGYSMGASIATIFAAEQPGRVQRLILIAPAGLAHAPGRFQDFVRRHPGLGDWLMLGFGGWYLRRGARQQAAEPEVLERVAEAQAAETLWRGYLPAVLSSQRNLLFESLDGEHRALAREGLPVAAIWGETDTVIPPQAIGRLAHLNGAARHVTVPGAGHGLVYTHTREVMLAIAEGLTFRPEAPEGPA